MGSGSEFGADLYVLYAAGRVHLPEVAATYGGLAASAHNLQPLLARCAETVPGGLDQLLPPTLDSPHPDIEPSPHGPMPVPGEL